MRVNRWWIAFAVPIVFDRVLDANGAFNAASRVVAALVFGVVVGFATMVVAYSPIVYFDAVFVG